MYLQTACGGRLLMVLLRGLLVCAGRGVFRNLHRHTIFYEAASTLDLPPFLDFVAWSCPPPQDHTTHRLLQAPILIPTLALCCENEGVWRQDISLVRFIF